MYSWSNLSENLKSEREKVEGANLTAEDKKKQRELVKAQKQAKKEAAANKTGAPKAPEPTP